MKILMMSEFFAQRYSMKVIFCLCSLCLHFYKCNSVIFCENYFVNQNIVAPQDGMFEDCAIACGYKAACHGFVVDQNALCDLIMVVDVQYECRSSFVHLPCFRKMLTGVSSIPSYCCAVVIHR